MFFLAFQEYLTWCGQTRFEELGSEQYENYLQDYRNFCRIHHLCDNLLDVYSEMRRQNI